MNAAADCHEMEGCPGLFVDAFRGAFLQKTTGSQNAFILSHYHGDHYGSLPRENKYQGPALIHCTPVTAALLRNVHQVSAQYVVEHELGKPWTYHSSQESQQQQSVEITFYDANHCPGAAIVTVQFHDGRVHLHTGDMRFHEKMKSYPVIQQAVRNRQLDIVYLDTTYGHPKHNFCPQEVAIDSIASQVHELLTVDETDEIKTRADSLKTLVLLSCYSIGKERVLWEASQRTNQLVYVTDKKLRMMQSIQQPAQQPDEESSVVDTVADPPCTSQMVKRCTRDPNETDIHVIPMGLAGELWPFFRPNYRNCVNYEEDLVKSYGRVVAFIPTGWANASNWNKKNAVSRRRIQCERSKRMVDVEIRLISYSEHSAFSELQDFVKFLKPRKIIPTVFSDDNDRRKIEKLFAGFVDSSRAKKAFFKTMQQTNHSVLEVEPARKRGGGFGMKKNQERDNQQQSTVASKDPGSSSPTRGDDKQKRPLIDLTFSSDDESSADPRVGRSSSLSACHGSLSERSPVPTRVTKGAASVTPYLSSPAASTTAKRKRGSAETPKAKKSSIASIGTPAITNFFAAKKKTK